MALSAVPVLYQRRLTLTVRTPRELLVPLVTPVLFAVIIAPALASIVAAPGARTAYMTFVALATAGLLIPLNTLFSGIGVIVDRQQGAQRELLVAPISRASIVTGNMLAAVSITALQVAVLVGCAALRGATFVSGRHLVWFLAAALVFSVLMYAVAELMANRLPSPEAYIGAVPAVAIVPCSSPGRCIRSPHCRTGSPTSPGLSRSPTRWPCCATASPATARQPCPTSGG
jgi:ABC-2 type transport system permease protein